MNRSLSDALKQTVKEVQEYSKEELRCRLDESEKSDLAKTVNEIRHLLSLIETNQSNIHNSMGLLPNTLGSRESNSATIFPKRPYLINIDVTKSP